MSNQLSGHNTSAKFAKLFEVDGQQLLMQVLPSEDEDNLAQGIPDPVISADVGWTRYEARSTLSITEEGRQKIQDINAYLLDDYTEEKARKRLDEINEDWSGASILRRMEEGGEEIDQDSREALEAPGKRFAALYEIDGQQVLATSANDLGDSENEVGLIIKVAGEPGKGPMVSHQIGWDLEGFDEKAARAFAELSVQQSRRPGRGPGAA